MRGERTVPEEGAACEEGGGGACEDEADLAEPVRALSPRALDTAPRAVFRYSLAFGLSGLLTLEKFNFGTTGGPENLSPPLLTFLNMGASAGLSEPITGPSLIELSTAPVA